MQHILASYTILCSPSHLPRLKVLLQCLLPKNCQTNCTCYRWRMLLLARPDCQTASLPACQFARLMTWGRGMVGLGVFWKPSRRLRRADLRQAPRLALASNLTAECADGCDSQDKTFGSCQERVFTCSQKCTAHRPLHQPLPFHPCSLSTSQATRHLIRLLDKQRLRR